MTNTGTLYIVAAPSGAGKTSLVNEAVATITDLVVSISHTTRARRPAEIDGTNYFFIDQDKFTTMVNSDSFLEYATVFNNSYGTSKQWVDDKLKSGIDVILEIDWQGAQQVREQYPNCIGIFIAPPSIQSLKDRLLARGQDDLSTIEERMAEAHAELSHCHEFDYLIINAEFSKALADLTIIIAANRLKLDKQSDMQQQLLSEE